MSEFHPDVGFTKDDYYEMAVRHINNDFDKKIKHKSFLTTKDSIEQKRKEALDKVKKEYYGNSK